MTDPAKLAVLITAITAFVTAIGGIIAVLRHANGPAHQAAAQGRAPDQSDAAQEGQK